MAKNPKLLRLYEKLHRQYGNPGPWPWFASGEPHTSEEIAIGAILTQNTSWRNVEQVLQNLRQENCCSIAAISGLGAQHPRKLQALIRPSGFYKQKSRRLTNFCRTIITEYQSLDRFFALPARKSREKLLALEGIGPETADTILLFAGRKCVFVIDAYTRRFLKAYGFAADGAYENVQQEVTRMLPHSTKIYQDFHALIIKWGKRPRVSHQGISKRRARNKFDTMKKPHQVRWY